MAKYLESYLNLRVQGKERELQAFQDVLFKIQLFRDKLRWVVHSPQSHGKATLLNELHSLVAGIAESYAQHQLYLTESDRLIVHDVKRECQAITEQVELHFNPGNEEFLANIAHIASREAWLVEKQAMLRNNASRAIGRFIQEMDSTAIQPRQL